MSNLDINIIGSALSAQQQAMSVTAQNVANVNTQGYRRQEVTFGSVAPSADASLNLANGVPILGDGVTVSSVQRAQTSFLDRQILTGNQQYSYSDSMNQQLQQVEAAVNEPSDSGISSAMSDFWNAWSTLSTTPDSLAARNTVVQTGQTLADKIQSLYSTIGQVQSQCSQAIASDADQVNQMASQIADLNSQITKQVAAGQQPNDLMDQRDLLVEKVSKLLNVQVNQADNSGITLSVNGHCLVQGSISEQIGANTDGAGITTLVWSDDNKPVQVSGGEIGGLIQTRDTVLQGYKSTLNTFAQQLTTSVNTAHALGQDANGNPAGDFFTAGSDASNISVDSSIVASPALVAAANKNSAAGDNSVASAIAGLQNNSIPALGNQTLGAVYGQFTAQVGTDVSTSATNAQQSNLSLQQLTTQRDSISGVSLDEEMTNMTKFQQAYNAATRVFTVIDSMMNTIVNEMGVIGSAG